MSVIPLQSELGWLRSFDPGRRMLVGRAYRIAKRLTDLAIVIAAAPLWLPLLGIIALAIAITSPGAPIIFVQARTGKGGRRFYMYKFRTMVPNSEALKPQFAHLNELKWPDFKITNDPRVTRLGGFLRRTSLDELPQLFNVLRGDMSLVGPRPELPFLVERYEPWQRQRLAVPPGMTGWWQINGRSEHLMHLHTEDDLYYIRNYSPLLDLQIMWRTVGVVLRGRGAY